MGDDHQLGVGAELVDEGQEAVQVHVVESGLHLIHHVEGRGPAAEHREQEGQRGQCPLAAREQRQPLHVLAGRLGRDLDAGVEEVVGLGEAEASLAAREQRLEQQLEVGGHVDEGRTEHSLDLGVDRADHPVEVAAGGANVVQLASQQLVALVELVVLGQSQRIDRAHDLQLGGQLIHPLPGVEPVGQLRQLRGRGVVRVQAVGVAQTLDRRLQPRAKLGLLDVMPALGPAEGLVATLRIGLPAPQVVEVRSQRPDFVGLPATDFSYLSESGVQDPRPLLHRPPERLKHRRPALQHGQATLGRGPGGVVDSQPLLQFCDPGTQHLLALLQPGVGRALVGGPGRQLRRTPVEVGAGLGRLAAPFLCLRLCRLQLGQAGLDLCDPRDGLLQPAGGLRQVVAQGVGPGVVVAPVRLGATDGVGRRRRGELGRGQPSAELVDMPPALLQPAPGQTACGLRLFDDCPRGLDPLIRLCQRGPEPGGAMHAEPPASAAQPVTDRCDHHDAGVPHPHVGRGPPIAVHEDRGLEQHVQQPGHARIGGSHPAPQRLQPEAGHRHGLRAAGAVILRHNPLQRDHRRAGVAGLHAVEHATRGGGVPHDHGADGVPRGGLEGCVEARVHLHEVAQQPQDTIGCGLHVDRHRPRGLIEGHGERLAPRGPVPQVALGR